MAVTEAGQFEQFIDQLGLHHFKGSELTPFWNASCKGVTNKVPPVALWTNVVPTLLVLNKLREKLGAAITITSAYRSPTYNAAVGGEPASFHLKFQAIDFQCAAGNPAQWAATLRGWRGETFALPESGGSFQFRGGVGKYSTFVHVDTRGTDADWLGS